MDVQRISGRVGCGETVGIPDGLVFAGGSHRRDDDGDHDDVVPSVGGEGLECVVWKRMDLNQEPQCPDAISKRADAQPGGGKPESLATKQTQVDALLDWKGVRIVLLMKVPKPMNPITPVGVKNRQGMKCLETKKQYFSCCVLLAKCSLQQKI